VVLVDRGRNMALCFDVPGRWSWATKPCSDPWCLWIGWLRHGRMSQRLRPAGLLRKRIPSERTLALERPLSLFDLNVGSLLLECCCDVADLLLAS
jgi:hypothetical protein